MTEINIILVGETKFNPNTPLKLTNYITYRTENAPRAGSPAHGGTALLVHRRFVHFNVMLNTIINPTSIEIVIGQTNTNFFYLQKHWKCTGNWRSKQTDKRM